MISLKGKNWEIKNIETVLFDKDGTFIDLDFFWGEMTKLRAKEVIKKYNLEEENLSKLCLDLGYDVEKEKMIPNGITALYSRITIIKLFTKKLKKYGICTTEKEIEIIFDNVSIEFYKEIKKHLKPIETAIEFIKSLHEKGIKLGIVTSDSVESTNLTLHHFGWHHIFKCVIGRESSIHTKESGIPTKLALKILNANPKTTIMIGDAPMDYISAKNAEIEKTILVATGQIKENMLKKISKYTTKDLSILKIEN